MQLTNYANGQRYAPLDEVELTGAANGIVIISDGARRVYLRVPARSPLRFVIGGTAGRHTVLLVNEQQKLVERLYFEVEATTRIEDAGGEFGELLNMLYATMLDDGEQGLVRWNGRVYRFFVRWLRDHVHVLKGMKYFHADLKSAIDLYRESQRDDGMIWDNVYPRSGPNYWDVRFAEGDFIRPVDEDGFEFKRIPVEADVEYLFVEGLHATWQATGDDGWMRESLDAAVRALDYCVASPYRWSETFGLIKRGYTIDTWDFQAEDDAVVEGDPMRVDPTRTRFGIMFGDNTGYIASCRLLADMLEHTGRAAEAVRFRDRAETMQVRLNEVSWSEGFFIHHVPEEYGLIRDLGVDEDGQLSLSNAYSLNRGIGNQQAAAIIRSYRALRNNLPEGSPGEWYTIFPPFERGFGGHNQSWQYMNAGVTPIVAGELARGAFAHGFERYGVDILRRLADLGQRHGNRFSAVYTGAQPTRQAAVFTPVDISTHANIDTHGAGADQVVGWTGEGDNDLHALPTGELLVEGVPFKLLDPAENERRAAIGMRRAAGYAETVNLEIKQIAASIYLLHCVSKTGAGGVGGVVTLHYADGTSHSEYIVRGVNASNWWFPEAPQQHGARTIVVGWRGANAKSPVIGLLAYAMANPHPEAQLEHISFTAAQDGAFWGICGVTLSDQPAAFPADAISYGIPDNWAAAAVVAALAEGLAGISDEATRFRQALVAPRWLAADVDEAMATIAYPASAGYVAYRYTHDRANRQFTLTLTGSGERLRCRLLLPPYAQRVQVVANGASLSSHVTMLEQSRYAEFEVALPGPAVVTVTY